MTTMTSSALMRSLSDLNEAVISHEADEHHFIGTLTDVAHAVGKLAVAFHEVASTVVTAIGTEAGKTMLQMILWANNQSQVYNCALSSSGIVHVGQGADLMRSATKVVAILMDHIDTILEELDK